MKPKNKRLLSLFLSAEIVAGALLSVSPVAADAAVVVVPGTPYDATGNYDPTVKHVIINQYFGSGTSTKGAVNYGFIELYNPTNSAVDLSQWSLQYADRDDDSAIGPTGDWQMLKLTGTIAAHSSFLIRGAASATPTTKLDVSAKKDMEFILEGDSTPIVFTNKGMKLALMSNQTKLDEVLNVNPFSNNPKPAGYVDMLGTGDNDPIDPPNPQTDIDGYETAYPAGPVVGSGPLGTTKGGTSKNAGLRRINFADTDNNKNDFVEVIYGNMTVGDPNLATYGPRSSTDGAWGVTPPPPSPLAISTSALPDASKGVAYSATVAVTGGTTPYTYNATGLPAGLSINSTTGVISGTPDVSATASNEVAVIITDNAEATASKTFTLNVNTAHADTLNITKLGTFIAGTPNADGGVAEIVKYNPNNHKFYSVNGSSRPATLDIVSLDSSGVPSANPTKINIENVVTDHVPGFAYGDFTSVDIDTKRNLVYAAIQEATYTKNGVILVFDAEGNYVTYYEAGVQPDMVKVTSDGRYVLTADEGEPRLAGADPDGSITVVDTKAGTVKHVRFDDQSVIDDNVHLRGTTNASGMITGPAASKAAAVYDLEPEYIALSADESIAYASLQEGNAIAAINIADGTVISVKGLGYKDLSASDNALDLVKDSAIKFENVPFQGMYMPDGIDTYSVGGTTYLFTANEGDGTEWLNDNELPIRSNVSTIGAIKGNLDPNSAAAHFLASKTVNNKTPYDSVEVPSDMGPDGIYLYGGRSFSIWDASTLSQVYDSHNDFEKITAERLPAYFNSDHKEVAFDKRSPKKGPEPEYVKVGKVGDKAFAFVGLERISGVMTYDVTDPTHPAFANYINTRDFTAQGTGGNPPQTDLGPEGIEFIPATASPTGLPLILVANEVGGTIAALQLNVTKITLNTNALSFLTGDAAQQLQATVAPVGGSASTVTWTSSNPAVATVNPNGQVTPIAPGTAVITALSADGYGVAEAKVTVTARPSSGSGGTGGSDSNTGKPDDSANTGTTPSTDGSKVTTEVKPVTDSSGKAAATVSDKQIDEALASLTASGTAGQNGTLEIKAVADANATKNTITLPSKSVDQIASSKVSAVTIDGGVARVTFDQTAVSTVAGAADSGEVSLSIERVSASDVMANLPAGAQSAVSAVIGSHPVYQFSVTADGKHVSDFGGGTATVEVAYTPAPGEDSNAIVIYYIADNGDIVMVPQTNYDKATGKLSFQVGHFSTYAVAYKQVNFKDTAASFAKDQIVYLTARGILQGTTDSSFGTKANVSRADFVLILARIAGADLTGYTNNEFNDVKANAYYAKAVAWAADKGITSGVSEGMFNPGASLSREQLVAMITRFADVVDYDLPKNVKPVAFADASQISAFAVNAANAVQQAGIINGTTTSNQAGVYFAPKKAATREEAAKMLAILYQGLTK
ncbi:S-layer family protein [Paenibacillus taihuensis]|uniref:S-layer family protein n=1 Tax=Paenibacillus taihuensis TaxID=1156355 RepID=A0A3D9S389_9BACL|nr:choice-of-anchor I family protein [Paenibacillus taihuensis]REE86485.1 S-layer family protein [Paenibacillus taihuensis]